MIKNAQTKKKRKENERTREQEPLDHSTNKIFQKQEAQKAKTKVTQRKNHEKANQAKKMYESILKNDRKQLLSGQKRSKDWQDTKNSTVLYKAKR